MIQVVEFATEPGLRALDGPHVVAAATDAEWARLAKVAARVRDLTGPFAVLGLGFGILAQLLKPRLDLVFFEIESRLATEYAYGHNVVLGDFRSALRGQGHFAAIINDTEVRGFDFTPFLAPGGLLIE